MGRWNLATFLVGLVKRHKEQESNLQNTNESKSKSIESNIKPRAFQYSVPNYECNKCHCNKAGINIDLSPESKENDK